MSADHDDREDDPARPARRANVGQYRKGTSGNPRGRPRKAVDQPALMPARFPTRELLRATAAKTITVTDASGPRVITRTEAVLEALSVMAIKGKVYAARAHIEYNIAEDERHHRERKESFEFWRSYQQRGREIIETALGAGRAIPDLLPHPDDIKLDWVNLEVHILGATDEEGRAHEDRMAALQDLAYELTIYTEEDNAAPNANGAGGRLGYYLALYMFAQTLLPKRRHRPPEAYDDTFFTKVMRPRAAWTSELEQRCREVGISFTPWARGVRRPAFPFEQIGIIWDNGARMIDWGRMAARRGPR